ncbi:unnamed protein product [Dovyalis caffra]|uniref:TF-B3 domain-containing protein n=1 Tax=Dovyalis caffra TaxID=77055 RepID=A0AAV1SUA3_9ROSI|nr:unnamed protein product [Dovyalis caffra]
MANFKKIASETDVKVRFSVPSKWFMKNLYSRFEGKSKLDILVKDLSGEVQSFGFSVRTKGNHFKPVICRGWGKFVREKALKPGNKIVFLMENDPEIGTEYKIEVIKEIKLFGRNIEGRV